MGWKKSDKLNGQNTYNNGRHNTKVNRRPRGRRSSTRNLQPSVNTRTISIRDRDMTTGAPHSPQGEAYCGGGNFYHLQTGEAFPCSLISLAMDLAYGGNPTNGNPGWGCCPMVEGPLVFGMDCGMQFLDTSSFPYGGIPTAFVFGECIRATSGAR